MTKAKEPTDRLDGYSPALLPEAVHRLALPAVVAAVRAVPDLPESLQVPYASRLCWFLSRTTAWDRASAPDLAALLTPEAIVSATTAAAAPELKSASRQGYRRDLRRIGRALGSVPARTPVTAPVSPGAADYWPAVRNAGRFTVLAAGYAARGLTVHGACWHGLGQELVDDGDLAAILHEDLLANADAAVTGTLAVARLAARALAAAGDVRPKAVSPVATSPSAPGPTRQPAGPVPSRRPSRTAAARAARAALKAQQAAAASTTDSGKLPGADTGLTVEPTAASAPRPHLDSAGPSEPTVPSDVGAAIANYRPQQVDTDVWAQVAAAAREGMRAARLASPGAVTAQGGHIARFAVWVGSRPERAATGPLAAPEMADEALVTGYVNGPLSGRPDSTRATARSLLRRMVAGLRPESARDPIAYTPIQPPYSPGECAAFVRLARNQPTHDLRRSLSAMVALGLGAGLDGQDQKGITPHDIAEVDLGDGASVLTVTVTTGPRPRTVVVREPYADLLHEAVALHARSRRGQHTPVYGIKATRRNVTSAVTQKAVTATGPGVNISAARLRSTWLLACMCAPVPLNVLLHTAGLRSARSLADLLPYCPDPDPAEVAVLLRNLRDPGTAATGPNVEAAADTAVTATTPQGVAP